MKKVLFVVMLSGSLLLANSVFAAAYIDTTVSVVSQPSACSSLTTTGLVGVAKCIISILDSITVVIIAASVVYIIYGAFNMIRSEEKRESGRETVVYGIIGLFVMISIWGFVNILNSTFNLKSNYIPAPQFHQQ